MCSWMTTLTNRIRRLPSYIIVVLEGAAIGGGAELLTLGDWIIADKKSKVGFVQARLGVTTGWGGGARLIDRIGKVKATHLIAMSTVISVGNNFEYRFGRCRHNSCGGFITRKDASIDETTTPYLYKIDDMVTSRE